MERPTLFDAMQAFEALTQAVAFTSNEQALFFALLRTWNAARRPAVIEQWLDTTCARCSLTRDTLPAARNGLVQKGAIFYSKESNRSVPKYSLNALFHDSDPLLREIRCNPPSNPPSKRRVSDGVSGGSYHGKEKEKKRDGKSAAPPSVKSCVTTAKQMFQNINTQWLESVARSFHSHFEMEDWQLRNGSMLLPTKWKQRLRTWIEEKARQEKPGSNRKDKKLFRPV